MAGGTCVGREGHKEEDVFSAVGSYGEGKVDVKLSDLGARAHTHTHTNTHTAFTL